jgi:hypothetical protein
VACRFRRDRGAALICTQIRVQPALAATTGEQFRPFYVVAASVPDRHIDCASVDVVASLVKGIDQLAVMQFDRRRRDPLNVAWTEYMLASRYAIAETRATNDRRRANPTLIHRRACSTF